MKTILESQSSQHHYPSKHKKLMVILASGLTFVLGYVAIFFFSGSSNASISANQIQIAEVKKGNLIKDVRAPGNMVANEKRWVAARVDARVAKRVLLPGAKVNPDSIILQLSSPSLNQAYKQAQIQLKVAEAQLQALIELQKTELQQQQADVSLLKIEKKQAVADLTAKQKLITKKIIPEFKYHQAILKQEQLSRQLELATYRLKQLPQLQSSLLKVEQAKVEQQQLQLELLDEQVTSLNVTAGMNGILQSLAVEEGQQVSLGDELARIASQDNLKIELKVPESLVKDVVIGQAVTVDTRRSKIMGQVSRIDPAVVSGTVTVDVQLTEALPVEARPDLRVEGIIEIEKLENILLLEKPTHWTGSKTLTLYKLTNETRGLKTAVVFGADSMSKVQVLDGLIQGDKVIISDLTPFQLSQQQIANGQTADVIQIK